MSRARLTRTRPAGRRLIGYLLRSPQWLAGWGAQVGVFAFQAVALRPAPDWPSSSPWRSRVVLSVTAPATVEADAGLTEKAATVQDES
jgi:hypothetical protein